MRYPEINTGLKRHVGLKRCAPKWSKIMTRLLNGKHFWIALVLATRCLIAPICIRRTVSLRFAPNPAASLRTVEDTEIHTQYHKTYIWRRHNHNIVSI